MSDVLESLREGDALTISAAFGCFGAVILIRFSLKVLGSFHRNFLRPGKDLKKLGKWAVVTGCTDGIGKAYAQALAKKGMSVVLISRTEAKLQDLQEEIGEKGYSGVETKYIVCDYSKFDDKAREEVSSAIKDLDIGVLVNNVGVSYRYPRFFDELADEEVANLMEMNVNSTTWMTKFVIGGMLERKRGAIVNISSASAMYASPLLGQYAAAKSYIVAFSRALNAEYAKKGITVQSQIPFYVATKLAKMRKGFFAPTPDEYVKLALKYVGQPESVVNPFWVHNVQRGIMDLLPESFVTSRTMSRHLGIREKGLKKDAAKADKAE